MYIKLALIIMGVSTLFFAITESFRLPNAKSYFIQILLPIETLLVLYAMIHLMNASKKFRKVMVYNGIYACVLCVISITYIYFMSKQGEKWIYYLLVLCYTVQFFFYTYIYLHITRLWKNSLDKSNRTFRKYHFRIWIEAFIIGLIGIITELSPTPLTQSLFTICYTLFFIHFSIRYHNYGVEAHNQIKKIAPALISDKIIIQPEESQEKKILKQNNDLIKEKIDCSPLEHKQLFAQLKAELDEGKRYWFSAEEESELKLRNQAYYALPTEAEMILHCFRLPEKGEDFKLYSAVYLFNILLKRYPAAMRGITINKMGRIMNSLGAERMHTTTGNMYKLVALAG